MPRKKGQSGTERRECLLEMLKKSKEPLKAAQLAELTGVSRQVIVQDMALLRAKVEPVIATPQGYIYFKDSPLQGVQRVIFSRHSAEDTERELNLLVDLGVQVLRFHNTPLIKLIYQLLSFNWELRCISSSRSSEMD